MWNIIWYLGVPMFAVSVFGAPYNKLDNDSEYNLDQFDAIYDQRQNGSDNYKLSIDGVSLIWSQNPLLHVAALLEPALYGEYPETSVDILLGPEGNTPEEKPAMKAETVKTEQLQEKPLENTDVVPTVLVIDQNQLTGPVLENTAGSKRLKQPDIYWNYENPITIWLPRENFVKNIAFYTNACTLCTYHFKIPGDINVSIDIMTQDIGN